MRTHTSTHVRIGTRTHTDARILTHTLEHTNAPNPCQQVPYLHKDSLRSVPLMTRIGVNMQPSLQQLLRLLATWSHSNAGRQVGGALPPWMDLSCVGHGLDLQVGLRMIYLLVMCVILT